MQALAVSVSASELRLLVLHRVVMLTGIRPILIACQFRKLAAAAAVWCIKGHFSALFQHSQFGSGHPGGAQAMYTHLAAQHRANSDTAFLQIDVANALGSIDKIAIKKALLGTMGTQPAYTWLSRFVDRSASLERQPSPGAGYSKGRSVRVYCSHLACN